MRKIVAEETTQEDLDRIADVIWWLKGYCAARELAGSLNDLNPAHMESLRKVRLKHLREIVTPQEPAEKDPPF